MKGRIYIAGPMRSVPQYNFPAFFAAESRLRAEGWDVVNPARLDVEAGMDPSTFPADYDWSRLPEGMTFRDCMARDLPLLVRCTAIHMLRGWGESDGAKVEREVALRLGLDVLYDRDYVVGFCGFARVGKDTAGLRTGYELLHYADALKFDLHTAVRDMPKELARPVMVSYGAARRQQDPQYWVKRLEVPDWLNCAVCDVRYANEVDHIHGMGGVVIRVHRPGYGPANDEEARSIAEIEARWPHMPSVTNDGTPDELGRRVMALIDEHYAGVVESTHA